MATVIFDVLTDLLEAEFKEFKWHLSNSGPQDNPIARGKLENANRHDVVDLMVQQYGRSDAGKIAVRALRQIKQNELADQLKEKLREVPEDVSAVDGASSGANASKTGVTVTINSASEGPCSSGWCLPRLNDLQLMLKDLSYNNGFKGSNEEQLKLNLLSETEVFRSKTMCSNAYYVYSSVNLDLVLVIVFGLE